VPYGWEGGVRRSPDKRNLASFAHAVTEISDFQLPITRLIKRNPVVVRRPFELCVAFGVTLLAGSGAAERRPHRAPEKILVADHAMNKPDADMTAMATMDQIPPDKLPPAQKIDGVGNAHLQITAKPEAQMWFDQGLNLLHDFWDYESERAFEQSVRVDPQCAMCYWGLYKAESFYHGTSQGYASDALARAVSLEKRASKRERLYIEATAAFENGLKSGKTNEGLTQEVRLWRRVVRQYPQDTQARIFLAYYIQDGFDKNGEPRTGQKESLAILEGVMKEDPNNSAANHYHIHAVEASAHPERATHSAEILASLAPASGHIVHMPGHIFYRLGDYARAEQAFAASLEVDERYMAEQHVKVDDDWNYVHNLMYWVADLLEEGKIHKAIEVSAKTPGARGELDSTLYTTTARDSISRLEPRLPVALRTGNWEQVTELLKASKTPAESPNLGFLARELEVFGEGMRAAEGNDVSGAGEASARFDAELWRLTQQTKDAPPLQSSTAGGTGASNTEQASPPKIQVMPDAMLQPLMNMLSVMSLELRGAILSDEKKIDDAKLLFARAAQEEKTLGYREPPNYIRPVGETEAAALMAAGDWSDAKAAFQTALEERPRSGFALYGVALCSEHIQDHDAAKKEYGEFLTAWHDADPDLSQVMHARAYLAAR
jgi:tetratricopeptide (TPR) repeat protein